MRVLVAFDKFKDSMTAPAACRAAAGALRSRSDGGGFQIEECPLADGGEGFADILTSAVGGRRVAAPVMGPRGERAEAGFGLVEVERIPAPARERLTAAGLPAAARRLGIVEMAEASGLAAVPLEARDPWRATSVGTGELIRAAIAAGAEAVLLGVGGSATNDLGLGALAALGLVFRSAAGEAIYPPFPSEFGRIQGVEAASPRLILPFAALRAASDWTAEGRQPGRESREGAASTPIIIACDVSNPLLGERGASAVFGPQKGLKPDDLGRMESEMARLARLLCDWAAAPYTEMDAPGAGAAGGISFGLRVAARAELVPGADLISDWLDLESRLGRAEIVVTGEGRFDDSSLGGKGPGALAARAAALGRRVHIFAGQVAVTRPPAHTHLHAITPPGTPLREALAQGEANLRRTVAAAALDR